MIKFNELSLPLKTAVVFSYIVMGFYFLAFLVGFILGVIGE